VKQRDPHVGRGQARLELLATVDLERDNEPIERVIKPERVGQESRKLSIENSLDDYVLSGLGYNVGKKLDSGAFTQGRLLGSLDVDVRALVCALVQTMQTIFHLVDAIDPRDEFSVGQASVPDDAAFVGT
jgi:hypothetical protein